MRPTMARIVSMEQHLERLSNWQVPAALHRILLESPELDRAYLVGGCVRDALWQLPVKDFDIEVYGLESHALAKALSRWGRVDFVGQSFGVLKLTVPSGEVYDFSLPRRDSKVAAGHRGFDVAVEPEIDPQEASSRRDFTFNALMYNYRRRELLDFHGGLSDLAQRVLRHVSQAFVEDPLRVLRGMNFAGRFELKAAPETIALCQSIHESFRELAFERVREEWFKWATRSRVPSAGLCFLADTGWIAHFPEIQQMIGVAQDPEWHPEGDVWTHTCHCCDALARLPAWQAADEETRAVLMLAVLLHDSGKPMVTQNAVQEGRTRIVSPGHDNAALPLVESFLARLGAPNTWRERVPRLVQHHMAHLQTITDRAVRRLARRLEPESIENLFLVISADYGGRPPKPATVSEAAAALRTRAQAMQLNRQAPQPILMGRHLIAWGFAPGKTLGPILEAAFEAQLDGEFHDLNEAKKWFEAHYNAPAPDLAGPPKSDSPLR